MSGGEEEMAATAADAAGAKGSSSSSSSSSTLSKFIWLSDLHYDPFYGREHAMEYHQDGSGRCDGSVAPAGLDPRGKFGCDSPLNLIRMAVLASRDVLPGPDFVLATGDFSRHRADQDQDQLEGAGEGIAMGTILSTVSRVLEDTFAHQPHSSIVPVLGNSDCFRDYYLNTTETSNTLLNLFADSFRGVLRSDNINDEDEAESTVRRGGYYSRDLSDAITLMVLNTVIYSINHMPYESDDDPLGQFKWMVRMFDRARSRGRNIMIVGHIPPTVGSYHHSHQQFWRDWYLAHYIFLVEKNKDVVSAQLFGHLHSDEFRVFPGRLSDDAPPVLLTASVTPVFGGNPSFRVVTYDTESGGVVDYDAYYFDLDEESTEESTSTSTSTSRWQKLYSFREAYGVDNMTTPTMRNLADAVGSSSETLDRFLSYERVGALQSPCNSRCQVEWSCTLTSASRSEYDDCVSARDTSTWTRGSNGAGAILAVAAAGLLGLIAIGAVGGMCFMCFRRRIKYHDVDAFNIDAYPEADNDDVSL